MKKLAILFLISFFLFSAFHSCNIEKKEIASSDVYQEVLASSEAYFNAVRSQNTDLVLSFWTYDLRIITGQQDIIGKEALRQFLGVFNKSSNIQELSINGREIHASDSLAVEIVEYSEIVSGQDIMSRTIQGKQIQVWIMKDDKWRISHMAFIPTIPVVALSQ
jgi:ketosteroid isomerase-like protein